MDEFVHNLLTKDMFCDVALPRVPHRQALEAAGALEPRVSALEEDIVDLEEQLEQAVEEAIGREMKMDISLKNQFKEFLKPSRGLKTIVKVMVLIK